MDFGHPRTIFEHPQSTTNRCYKYLDHETGPIHVLKKRQDLGHPV